MVIMRKVARASFWGTEDEFNKFWQLPDRFKKPEFDFAAEFKTEEYKKWYNDMKQKHLQ